MASPTTEARPLRADARRNRERVLAAARAVFAEDGSEAQMDEIARRAEVGVGTVYRHFPTKDALVAALVTDSFERLADAARDAVDEPDPWKAFEQVLWRGAELLAANRGVSESLATLPTVEESRPTDAHLRLHDGMTAVMDRAKAAGVLRADACIDDIPMLMCGVGMATRKPHRCAASWKRHLSIVLDGLRAPAATGRLPD
ncbi:MAG TPA: helix-turn-helix domain-containing protein [Solirubrobacteraceae bacterium]|jgi:AcrR family transcriptional regulator